jgi:hypothetical protein
MTEFKVRVIDGLSNEAGAVWTHMTETVDAESAATALDVIEAEIDADAGLTAANYDCEVGDEIIVTISVFSEAGCAERVLRYEAA